MLHGTAKRSDQWRSSQAQYAHQGGLSSTAVQQFTVFNIHVSCTMSEGKVH